VKVKHPEKDLPEWAVDVYNRSKIGTYLASKELQYIKDVLQGNAQVQRVLEIGCGSGKIAIPLHREGYEMVGVDIDELPLQLFRRNNGTVRIARGDALDLPFRDGTFDCAMAIELMDSIVNRERSYMEVLRVLKPGGLFLIQFSNKRSVKGLVYELYLKVKKRKRTWDDLENYRRDFDQQAAELKDAGFRIINARGYNWNLIPRNSNSRLIDFWRSIESLSRFELLPSLSPLVLVTAIKTRGS
jgi:ubiquinone/menaquinone biosynthesis C-methylase UbiE